MPSLCRLYVAGEVRDLDLVKPNEALTGRAEAEVVVDRDDVSRSRARLAAALWRGAARPTAKTTRADGDAVDRVLQQRSSHRA